MHVNRNTDAQDAEVIDDEPKYSVGWQSGKIRAGAVLTPAFVRLIKLPTSVWLMGRLRKEKEWDGVPLYDGF